jgi:hypothetical protein
MLPSEGRYWPGSEVAVAGSTNGMGI